ncbi:MAG: hypothetical protein RL023_405, partial [Candidatus Parcubacteria bacterium]
IATASISSSANQLNCNVQSATLTATGNGTFLWSNGLTTPSISINQQGIYSVTVTTANGCTATATQQVSIADTLTLSKSSTSISCFGGTNGSITLTAETGTLPVSYVWEDDAIAEQDRTELATGIYTVTATDANGCTVVESFTLSQPEALSIADTIQHEKCRIGTGNGEIRIKVSGGTQPYSYDWINTSNFDDNVATRLVKGLYGVVVSDVNGCTISKDSLEIRCNDCLVAPNPSQQGQSVRIDFDTVDDSINGEVDLEISNMNGRVIKTIPTQVVKGRIETFILTDFGTGTFLLKAFNPKLGQKINFVERLIIM